MRLTRVTNVRSALPAGSCCELRVLSGPDAGMRARIPPVGAVVGADPAADIRLADSAVSGRHCSVAPAEQGFRVQDLGSRNGTRWDGATLESAVVPVGALLRVGTSLLQLLPEMESVSVPLSAAHSFGELAGHSVAMRQVYGLLERASGSSASILFLGESGTGKELAARAVHTASPRSSGPFVVFDCGAASETLIASDLFGHTKGAFTGAEANRTGAFAAAHGGTLFLDEIGDLPLALQPKLLRMLEAGEVTPLGSHTTERYDVRIVAATHRDLWGEVGTGSFRGDLYYRLAVVEVQLPPLRQRLEDIAELAGLFLHRAGVGEPGAVAGANLERLRGYNWPGNVRELRNVIDRAVALAAPGASFDEMPILLRAGSAGSTEQAVTADRPFHELKAALIERFERSYLTDLLQRANGNLSEAARNAGLERKYLYRVLDRHSLRPR